MSLRLTSNETQPTDYQETSKATHHIPILFDDTELRTPQYLLVAIAEMRILQTQGGFLSAKPREWECSIRQSRY